LRVRARAERTSNISCMPMTLEVSKLSGWLKARAYCRVDKEGRAMRGEVRAAGGGRAWGGGGASGMHGEGPTQGLRVRARAGRT
jgi:hypothetical protein